MKAISANPRRRTTCSSLVLATLLFGFVGSLKAAIYSYNLSNLPSVQGGFPLDGTITIDTSGGIEDGSISGNFYLSHSAIIAWNFTLTDADSNTYVGSSNGINASATGNGGLFAMYATPTSLTLISAASLIIESDEVTAGADISVQWFYDTPIYYGGGTAAGGQIWLNSDRAALDTAFTENPDASNDNWVIATAVPEPAAGMLVALGAVISMLSRRRS